MTLGEKGDGHKIVVATRGDRDILVRPGDVIVGVGGYSVKAMSCEDVEALLEGPPGTCIAVSLVRADEVQGVADEAMAAEPDSPKLDGGEEDGCKGAKADVTVAEGASAPAPRMVQVNSCAINLDLPTAEASSHPVRDVNRLADEDNGHRCALRGCSSTRCQQQRALPSSLRKVGVGYRSWNRPREGSVHG